MNASLTSPSTSSGLIQRVQRHEASAWREFTELYLPLVYRWARHTPLQPSDAADIAQAVFLAVWRNTAQFDSERPGATFRGWLRRITRNQVLAWYRKQARVPQAAGGDLAQRQLEQLPQLSEIMEPQEQEASQQLLLRKSLNLVRQQISPQTWEAFWRTTALHQEAGQVAQQLGMNAKAVRQAKYRVLCMLRNLLCDR